MKVAIVHDWLPYMGGAERIILVLHKLFPQAPIYTLIYNKERMPVEFHQMDIRTSFIQKLPFGKTKYPNYLPLFPTAVEQFDLSEYDVVFSSSTSVAKGVITGARTLHICYCNTPMRYAWDFYHEYLGATGGLKKKLIPWLMNYIRMWDKLAADRVDYYIANSSNVARRILKHYRRDSAVIHPPVEASFYQPSETDGDYFLVVSRLVSYKRVDLAIEACNRLGLPLKVVGEGPELGKLKELAGPTVKLLGRVSDEETKRYYSQCRAFLFPGEEDFGITPLEAQASGRPVLAYGRGGALETVIDGQTGLFFPEQTVESLVDALQRFEQLEFDPKRIRQHALEWDTEIFAQKIKTFVDEKYHQFQQGLDK